MTAGLIRLGDHRRKDLPTCFIYEQANRRVFKQSVHLTSFHVNSRKDSRLDHVLLLLLPSSGVAKPLTGSCVVI